MMRQHLFMLKVGRNFFPNTGPTPRLRRRHVTMKTVKKTVPSANFLILFS
jgi:hypothetical protein